VSTFVTVKKSHADFLKYLWGDFSTSQAALPVATMNVESADETITFEIIDRNTIAKPHSLKTFILLTKFQNLFLVVLQLFYVLIKNYVDNRFRDPVTCLIASVAMLFLSHFRLRPS
jgi:hypothetical protein